MNVTIPTTQTGQIAWLIKNVQSLLKRPSASGGGGFDATADPVIIGAGSHPSMTAGAIAIGNNADAPGTNGISIGNGSGAPGNNSIAIGTGAGYTNTDGIAIGNNADVEGTSSIGIGANVYIAPTHTQAVAIGAGAFTTKAHQIMLGTSTEFVEIPGSGLVLTDTATSTRYLLQVTSGAVVLNTAP